MTSADQVVVVDSHVHFWDPAALRYPWLEARPSLERAFLPPDYFIDHHVPASAVIAVEANCETDAGWAEREFVRRLSGVEPRIAGFVAFVDLTNERTRSGALDRMADAPLVVGVRQNIQGRVTGFCTNDVFVRGVREVGARSLTFDLCVTADQLADVDVLVGRCADTQFILDHCAKPEIRTDAFVRWSEDLARLATHPNVSCKLSGLFTEAREEQRAYAPLRPYAEHAHDCFGSSRLMFGSDWPLVTAAGGASSWRAFTDEFTASWTPFARKGFYADNATRLYGLELHDHS